jgi:hypothetical protein
VKQRPPEENKRIPQPERKAPAPGLKRQAPEVKKPEPEEKPGKSGGGGNENREMKGRAAPRTESTVEPEHRSPAREHRDEGKGGERKKRGKDDRE